jgi:hypothetical protein
MFETVPSAEMSLKEKEKPKILYARKSNERKHITFIFIE